MSNLTSLDIGIIFGGVFFFLAWLFFFILGLKYNSMFESLDEKEYPLKEIYGLGYVVLEIFHYKYKSNGDRKLRQQLEVLYTDKYSEYYLRVIHAQQVTFLLSMLVLAFALYGIGSGTMGFLVGLMFAFVAYYYFGTVAEKRIKDRSAELLRDFSEVVSKLALLTNAGMILRDAWQMVAFAGKGVIYTEMQKTVDEMNNGLSEVDATYNFGVRCMIPEVKKFTSTIIQGMTKGNSELVMMLQQQSKEVWELKKQLVRREGEKAASKLLIPICIMFVGILIMILIPIFTNLGT